MVSASINTNHMFLAEEDGSPRGVLYSPALMNNGEKPYENRFLYKPYYWKDENAKLDKRDDVFAILVVYLEMVMNTHGQKKEFEKYVTRFKHEEEGREMLLKLVKDMKEA